MPGTRWSAWIRARELADGLRLGRAAATAQLVVEHRDQLLDERLLGEAAASAADREPVRLPGLSERGTRTGR